MSWRSNVESLKQRLQELHWLQQRCYRITFHSLVGFCVKPLPLSLGKFKKNTSLRSLSDVEVIKTENDYTLCLNINLLEQRSDFCALKYLGWIIHGHSWESLTHFISIRSLLPSPPHYLELLIFIWARKEVCIFHLNWFNWSKIIGVFNQKTLTYFVRGSTTVWLTSCLTS